MFGKKKKKLPEESTGKELTIEDLVTLERYDDAELKLKARLKLAPKDLHAHLRLAEVYVAQKNLNKALDEYFFVADSYVDDGFFDKGIAVLNKVVKLAPGDDTVPRRIERFKRKKRLEGKRLLAVEGLLANTSTATSSAANRTLEVEMLWNKIAKSHLVEQLEGEALKKLFSVMEMCRMEEGAVLAESGASNEVLYLLVDGEVEAQAQVGAHLYTIRTFSTGDVIGESALLERKSWPATYKVTERLTAFQLNRDGLEQTMVGNPDPVRFLSTLRQQNHDRDVAANLMKLRSG